MMHGQKNIELCNIYCCCMRPNVTLLM